MATEVRIPDMGEGIPDVTINRWLVQEGEPVQAGATLVEVATDKVDTEIAAPADGVLLKRLASDGEIVDVGAVIALIGEPGEAPDLGSGDQEAAQPAEIETAHAPETAPETAEAPAEAPAVRATPVARRVAAELGVDLAQVPGAGSGGQVTKADVLAFVEQQGAAQREGPQNGAASPTEEAEEETAAQRPPELADVASLEVRRLAATYNVNLREVAGERPLGALTRYEVLRYVAERDGRDDLLVEPPIPAAPPKSEGPGATAPGPEVVSPKVASPKPVDVQDDEVLVPHSRMRQIIARNMVQSAFTAPHVTTVHSVDMSAVTAHYQAHKAEFARQGVRLTLTAYIVQAIVAGLRAVPAANSTWTEEGLLIKRTYNIGMAVALPPDEWGVGGLIVPVIKNAGDLSLLGVARQVDELARKARNNELTPADLQGGTFTLTNYGTSGSRFQTPVIFQPQAAILGTGAIEKRPVVLSDAKPYEASIHDTLAFRPMMDIALSYDHRVLDGASADAFCQAVKQALETWT